MLSDIERVAQARNIPLTEQDKAQVADFERGQLLASLVKHPGWSHVLDIMEARVEEAEHELINYHESDTIELLSLQRRAKAMRDFFHNVQAHIEYFIQETQNAPDILTHLGL